jgi:hypothetical protein
MRANITRGLVGALLASLCGGAYPQGAGAGGGRADAGTTANSKTAGGTSKRVPATNTRDAGGFTGSTKCGASAGTTESPPLPPQNQMDTGSAVQTPASGSGLKKPY